MHICRSIYNLTELDLEPSRVELYRPVNGVCVNLQAHRYAFLCKDWIVEINSCYFTLFHNDRIRVNCKPLVWRGLNDAIFEIRINSLQRLTISPVQSVH